MLIFNIGPINILREEVTVELFTNYQIQNYKNKIILEGGKEKIYLHCPIHESLIKYR